MSSLHSRFATYRPWLERLLFGGALLGILVVLHIGIQQARGFDQGCTGLGLTDGPASAFDCAAVVQSGSGTLLGLSNVIWGLGFYVLVAALTAAAAFVARKRVVRLRQLRSLLIGGGLLYSVYLVYLQVAVIGQLCALCMVSAGLVAGLAALQGIGLFSSHRSRSSSMKSSMRKRELALFSSLAVLVVVLAGADVAYFGQPSFAASDTLTVADGCRYDAEKPPVQNTDRLVNFQDPVLGDADAPVTVIEYFDPNCPHCKTMHNVLKRALDQHGDEARFVFKPMPLWGYSVPQIEAMYAAAQEDKFFEMIDRQFEAQQRGGLNLDQLKAIARDVGMNPDVLAARLQQQTYRERVLEDRKQAVNIGVDSTPTVLVNGRFIEGSSRSLRCLGEFIEAAKPKASTSTTSG